MLHIYAYLVNMYSYCINFVYVYAQILHTSSSPIMKMETSQMPYVFSRFKNKAKQNKTTQQNPVVLAQFRHNGKLMIWWRRIRWDGFIIISLMGECCTDCSFKKKKNYKVRTATNLSTVLHLHIAREFSPAIFITLCTWQCLCLITASIYNFVIRLKKSLLRGGGS